MMRRRVVVSRVLDGAGGGSGCKDEGAGAINPGSGARPVLPKA